MSDDRMTPDQARQLHDYHHAGFDVHYRGERLSQWKTDSHMVMTMTHRSPCLDDPWCWIPAQILDVKDFVVYSHVVLFNWEDHE